MRRRLPVLIHFILDYAYDPDLDQKFAKDPMKVLKDYEVAESDIELLGARDRAGLLTRLHEDAEKALEKALAIEGEELTYPKPHATGMHPDHAETEISLTIPFTIFGSYLKWVKKVAFISGTTETHATHYMDGKDLKGDVDLPPHPGIYVVRLHPGNDVPGGFKAA